jgi:hypothetical protein
MPIYGKVGRVGHGKTMMAVVEAVELARRRKALLVSNIRLRPPDEYALDVVQLPMDGFSDALMAVIDEARTCDVCELLDEWWGDVAHGEPGCKRRGLVLLIDEVDTIWDAKEWQEVTKTDRFFIKESRKLGVDLIWTAQFVDQVEKGLRNITETVELMRAIPSPKLANREKGKRPWMFVGQSFRPGAVRELTASVDPDKRLGRRFIRYRRKYERWYNTDDLVVPERRERTPGASRRYRYGKPAALESIPPA